MRRLRLTLFVVLVAMAAGACAKAQARTEPEMPLLQPPAAPPRVVEYYADEPIPTIAPSPAELALVTPSRPVTRPPAPRPEPPKAEPARSEPERPASPPPALTLKPQPGTEAQTQASIRELLNRASRDLQRVNYPALNADGRTQYNTARRFMQQTEEALKVGNIVFAGKLADKAATMAAVLVRRGG